MRPELPMGIGASLPTTEAELSYLRERAEQEIKRAQTADHPNAVRAHYELAGYYLDRVYNRSDAPAEAQTGSGSSRRRSGASQTR